MDGFNPQGCPVTSFKVPTAEELAHDYLWRVHQRVPGKGEIGIFNRSHYEDVLVVRVHDLVPKAVWSSALRPDQRLRARCSPTNGTTIVKFFLSIDRDEQRKRFQARYDDPTKRWKFSLGDLEERKRWDDYLAAFERRALEDARRRRRPGTSSRPTASGSATWPSRRSWPTRIADLKPAYPAPQDLPPDLVIE